jgi:hypothetical protein
VNNIPHYPTGTTSDPRAALAGVFSEPTKTFTEPPTGLDRLAAGNVLAEIATAAAGASARLSKGTSNTPMPPTTFLPLRL